MRRGAGRKRKNKKFLKGKNNGIDKERKPASDYENYLLSICEADETRVQSAFSNLGPINCYTDLLNKSEDSANILATEQIVHMTECWRYFSSALFAYLNHELPNAIHFAYYAQLRAALSLFSGSGIRIKRNNSYWIDRSGTLKKISGEVGNLTHKFAADFWEKWIHREDAKTLLADDVHLLQNVSLRDFKSELKLFSYTKTLQNLGHDFIDLSVDHRARNIASYEPYWAAKPLTRMKNDDLIFIKELSRLFLTSGHGLVFDKALIQYLVHHNIAEVGLTDADEDQEPTQEEKDLRLKEMTERIAPIISVNRQILLEILSENVGGRVFRFALDRRKAPSTESIISRAAFLVRYAMLSVKRNITISRNEHVKKWIQNWLERCGCWMPGIGVELEDLEIDYADAIFNLPDNFVNLPFDLWNDRDNCYIADIMKMANPHLCLAWGVAA